MRVLAAAPIDSVAILCLRRVKFYEESSWFFDVKSLRPAVSSNFPPPFRLVSLARLMAYAKVSGYVYVT